MDAKQFMQTHADNAVAGKMAEVMKDLTPESLAQVGPLMVGGPNPLEANNVVARGQDGEDHVFDVTYTGGGKSLSMREWVRNVGGTFKIVKLETPS
jgi:hypothetical protein